MDVNRWNNVQGARRAWEMAEVRPDSGPLEAFFEVSARCNLACQMCAINYDARYLPGSKRPSIFVPDLFARLRPIFPTLVRAYLFGLGEPLLNPHLIAYIRELADAGVDVSFNTNATLIDQDKADAIAAAGASHVTVSIDGATRETYEKIRVGASFDAAIRGARALISASQRYGRPKVSLSLVAMASNIAELPRMVDLSADLGAIGLHVEPLLAQGQADLDEHYARENLGTIGADVIAQTLEETRRRADTLNVRVSSRLFQTRTFDFVEQARSLAIDWTCTEPWSSIWVTSAGEVRTCCLNATSFGNLFDREFAQIWNGAEYVAFRRQHAQRELALGCSNCVRNGRVRHSSYFASVDPASYRPRPRPSVSGPVPIHIESPSLGATVTDPIVVAGRIAPEARGHSWEVMLEDTPVGIVRCSRKVLSDGDFVFAGPIPFVTEGTHQLWMRRTGEPEGYGHRDVHLWRPEVRPGSVRATSVASLVSRTRLPLARVRTEIDGRTWRAVRYVRTGWRYCAALLDLADLSPGEHSVVLRVNGRPTGPVSLEKLATSQMR